MMTGPLLLALMTAAPEPSAVVLARRLTVSSAEATVLVDRIAQRLDLPGALAPAETEKRLQGLALRDAMSCGGQSACHAELARQLGVRWLVLVSVSQIAQDESLALELFDAAGEAVVASESVLLETPGEVPLASVSGFRAVLLEHVAPRSEPAPAAAVAPVVVQPIAVETNPWPPGRLVVGSLGVAALGTAVGFFISGLVLRAQLADGPRGMDGMVRSALSGSQAQQLQTSATVQLSLSAGLGAVGIGLGVVTFVW